MKPATKAILLALVLTLTPTTQASPDGTGILVNEILYDVDGPEDGEWIELYNPSNTEQDIGNWMLTDQEGAVSFPPETAIASHSHILVARNGQVFFEQNPGVTPDFEMSSTSAHLADMEPVSGGILRLSNTGDEVILQNSSGEDVDVLVYANGQYEGAGWTTAAIDVSSGISLTRVSEGLDTNDCSADFSGGNPPTPQPSSTEPSTTSSTLPPSTSTMPATTTTIEEEPDIPVTEFPSPTIALVAAALLPLATYLQTSGYQRGSDRQ